MPEQPKKAPPLQKLQIPRSGYHPKGPLQPASRRKKRKIRKIGVSTIIASVGFAVGEILVRVLPVLFGKK